MLKTLIFGRVITREEISHLVEVTNETTATFARLYGLTEEEFLKSVDNGKIHYNPFLLRLLQDLFVCVLIGVFSEFIKRKN